MDYHLPDKQPTNGKIINNNLYLYYSICNKHFTVKEEFTGK